MFWLGWVRFVSARQVHGHCDVDVFTENDLTKVGVGHFLCISVQLTTVIETRYRKVNDKKVDKNGSCADGS